MNTFSHVPPGFRFHPTDEELVNYYLRKKVSSKRIDLDVIKDVDLYKIEPWDLQELCKIGTEEQNEWYFFSHKDKKYPTGTRTNRATKAGFWKATGRDKAIYTRHCLIGMRKTLVFYKGRAPNGQKSDWIMHEYRLETNENGASQEEGWVVCRVFKKRVATVRKVGEYESPWYDDQVSFMQELDSPMSRPINHHSYAPYQAHPPHYPNCKQELELQYNIRSLDAFLQLPQLESPKVAQPNNHSLANCNSLVPYAYHHDDRNNSTLTQEEHVHQHFHQQSMSMNSNLCGNDMSDQAVEDQVTDWRVLDKFVASQLSHDHHQQDHQSPKENCSYSNNVPVLSAVGTTNMQGNDQSKRLDIAQANASTSTSSCQIDLWK